MGTENPLHGTVDSTDADALAQNLIHEAYEKMKETKPGEALECLEQALRADYTQQEALYALKCLNWWLEQIKNFDNTADAYDPYSKGNFLLSQWKSYYGFLDLVGNVYDRCQYAVKRFVYGLALQNFIDAVSDGSMRHDPGLLEQIGRCYKGMGSYEEALDYLKQAVRFKQEDAAAISTLADIYALLGETKAAKALFREAFFINPQAVDLYNLESDLILKLIGHVAGMGYTGAELREWIPVYGAVLGIFTVKRALKPAEVGRLKQQIFDLESELRGSRKEENLLAPALLNRYFRLMDHYESADGGNDLRSHALIDEIKLKIKVIKPVIFERYMS
ncbi:MAG: tetratricopeptide repeat protein [Spirochaetaceae bacterium]|jgi:tetratricopeptide (TPR) repeat protein|nr:tetratricopeptide repeat protein [Spirochaetaceae bacterium]